MQPTVDILTILTELAPLALSTLILAAVVLLVLYIILKVVIPAMHQAVQMAEVQRLSWKSIVDEQQRLNQFAREEMQREMTEERVERTKLAVRVEELGAELARKDARIAELEQELGKLRAALTERDQMISMLRAEVEREKGERARVERERAELLHRVEALEKATKPETKPDPTPPASPPGIITATGGNA